MFKLFIFLISFFSLLILSEDDNLGNQPAKTILFWDSDQKLYGFKNMQQFLPTRVVKKSKSPYPLSYNLINLDNLTYEVNGNKFSIENYLNKFKVVGLIVVRNDQILYEKYNFGNNEESKWVSFSVTKSITSMLLGAAIKDGFIRSVEDQVSLYLPQLNESNYEKVTIEEVLHMSSGINWNEDYQDPLSDVSIAGGFNSLKLYEYLNSLGVSSEPGTKFNYNTGETNLLGGIVRSAIGNNLSEYLEKKIWQPFGMEHDAYWSLDNIYEVELGGCCLNMTLRDFARIGIFAMNKGLIGNTDYSLPSNWMTLSTTSSPNYEYYGYQWWLDGKDYKSFYADGIFGQFIWIDPSSKTVVAMQSAWDTASDQESFQHRYNFMVSLLELIKN